MHTVEPSVYKIAETKINREELRRALESLSVPDWETDAQSGSELLIEFGGRLCYKSFDTKLNANLTRIREGNAIYMRNILESKHGSVLEHASVTFLMRNVSRILTHEQVRHRQGAAYSQESMRFVRLDDLGMYGSECLTEEFLQKHLAQYTTGDSKTLMTRIRDITTDMVERAEDGIRALTKDLGLDNPKMPFALKKKLTSFLRRYAPGGLTTDILVTANHRAWRHMIESRTAGGAEEEIIHAYNLIAQRLIRDYPAIYQDVEVRKHDDMTRELFQYSFKNQKV